MCIKDRIERLRQKMEEHHISVYMIPTADYHQSEYVGEQSIYHRIYRISRDCCHHKRRKLSLDGRKIFPSGRKPASGKRNPSAEDGRTGSAYDRRIYRICTGRI